MTDMGHYCRICGRTRANERFSGRGHRDHICRDCQRLPKTKRDRVERLDELEGFLRQSNISDKNVARLELLRNHADEKVRKWAELILSLARVCRHRRRRLPLLVRQRWPTFLELIREFGGDYIGDYIVSYHGGAEWLWDAVERAAQELGLDELPENAWLDGFALDAEAAPERESPSPEDDNIPF